MDFIIDLFSKLSEEKVVEICEKYDFVNLTVKDASKLIQELLQEVKKNGNR